jgi:iron(III) transport system permease protein
MALISAAQMQQKRADAIERLLPWVWSGSLLATLGFLVIYPMLMLIVGAFTVVSPTSSVTATEVSRLSLQNFVDTLTSPAVGQAVLNSIIACGAGTFFAVILGVMMSWIVVRTNTPARRIIGEISKVPLFIPPLVAAVAWSILGSPDTGLLNIFFQKMGIEININLYSMAGLITVFAMYYCPYVYMFASSALMNMDPSFEEASEISGAGALRTQFQITFPLIAPAILSSMLLSFVIMLGIYGVPAVLGLPANISLLPVHLYQLTVLSPPQYNAAAAVSIIMILVTLVFVYLQYRILAGRSYVTISGKGFRPKTLELGMWRWFTFALALIYIVAVVILPIFALTVTAFRKFMFIPSLVSLFDLTQYSMGHFESLFDNPQTLMSMWNTLKVGLITAVIGLAVALSISYTVQRSKAPGRRLIDMISTSAASIPGLIVGVAYLWAWIGLPDGLYGTLWILGLALVGRHIPDAARILASSLIQVHKDLEEAAWIAGSGMFKTVRTIILPLCKPGVIATVSLLFILSVRELGTSLFLYTADTIVMPVLLLGLYESGTLGTTAAFGLFQIIFIAGVIGLANAIRLIVTRNT